MKRVAFAVGTLLLANCGTILHDRTDLIAIDSKPSNATATIACDGGVSVSGTTPVRLRLPRKANGCALTVSRDGFTTETMDLERGTSGGTWANSFWASGLVLAVIAGDPSPQLTRIGWGTGLFGLGGFIVDRVTGAGFSHNPEDVKIELKPAQ